MIPNLTMLLFDLSKFFEKTQLSCSDPTSVPPLSFRFDSRFWYSEMSSTQRHKVRSQHTACYTQYQPSPKAECKDQMWYPLSNTFRCSGFWTIKLCQDASVLVQIPHKTISIPPYKDLVFCKLVFSHWRRATVEFLRNRKGFWSKNHFEMQKRDARKVKRLGILLFLNLTDWGKGISSFLFSEIWIFSELWINTFSCFLGAKFISYRD